MLLIAFIGGVFTLLNPCILPILPFVLANAKPPFYRNGLPFLTGLAVMFAIVATLAVSSSQWVIQANEYGRWLSLGLLSLFALSLCFERVGLWLMSPFVRMGNRLNESAQKRTGIVGSALLGSATGLLWVPCAGPILGLIMAGAMMQGASVNTSALLLSYAAGSAFALAGILLLSGRVYRALKRRMGITVGIRRGLGIFTLAGVMIIVTGLDKTLFSTISSNSIVNIEQRLLHYFNEADAQHQGFMPAAAKAAPTKPKINLKDYGAMPVLNGGTLWLNSKPLLPQDLKGKVVLVDFWTFGCINCIRSGPYLRDWEKKYRDQGLVVVGVHTPEFAFEKNPDGVRKAISKRGITYPVVMDDNYAIWRSFNNRYWPAHYFVDVSGQVRYYHFGEGDYKKQEQVIQQLLEEVKKA